ncbi:MGMT family protein [Candidatus Kaiserbacteria bacterium]|nr:MGMT family protein [Candidatus Kaiserbacteria bacterium]
MKSSFADRVRDVVRQIPKGETLPYRVVARLAGSPRAARAVGTIMKNNYDPSVPCHRVIRSDGKIGDYNRGGKEKKRALLRAEGVKGI